MSEIKQNKMGTMPCNQLLLTMSVPMMLSMLVQALYLCLPGERKRADSGISGLSGSDSDDRGHRRYRCRH